MLTRLFKDYAYRVTCLSSIFVVVVVGDVAVDVVVWAACAHALPLSSASAGDNLRAVSARERSAKFVSVRGARGNVPSSAIVSA